MNELSSKLPFLFACFHARAQKSMLNCHSGAARLRRVHQVRQGPALPAVRGDDQVPHRGSAGGLPQADDHGLVVLVVVVLVHAGPPAHLRRDGERALRLPAHGEALHAAHHDQDVQHPRGSGDAQAVRESGERSNVIFITGALCFEESFGKSWNFIF